MPEKARSQADGRRNQVIMDQYGRNYTVAMDIKIDEPTGAIIETGWDDPLRTPRHLFRLKRDTYGRPMFEVRLVQWLDEQRQADSEWKRRYAFFKRHMPRTASEGEMLEEAGPSPWPTVKALEQALAGSKSLLGIEPLTAADLKVLELDADEARRRGLKVAESKKREPVAVGA